MRARKFHLMIQSFSDDLTKQLFDRIHVRRLPAPLQQQAYKRLSYLNAAKRLEDLYIPPSNHFHSVGDRFSIRVNMQWRITFRWTESGPMEVRFEDYH
jgi:toxin HigB-1